MQVHTEHSKDERGIQETERVVEHDGEEYRFAVDLDAAGEERDGHRLVGDRDRGDVPAEVEQALGETGAGAEVQDGE